MYNRDLTYKVVLLSKYKIIAKLVILIFAMQSHLHKNELEYYLIRDHYFVFAQFFQH